MNRNLFALGIPSYQRKTVGDYLESLGASTDAPPPFPPKPDTSPDAGKEPVTPNTKLRQISLL